MFLRPFCVLLLVKEGKGSLCRRYGRRGIKSGYKISESKNYDI